ncbi:MAG TPA: M48 family metallopeptidase [Verrucomicrobiae bacterium]
MMDQDQPTAIVCADHENGFSPHPRPQSASSATGARRLAGAVLLGWLLFQSLSLPAQEPASPAPAATAAFDTEAATRTYLQRMTTVQKARSDAYFEGGYWLQLWQFLYGCAVAALFLETGLSARLRNLALRLTRFKPLQTAFYAIQYTLVAAVLSFPLTVYSDFFREHKYGLATQSFGLWFGDWTKSLLVGLILGSLFMMVLFGVVRRLQRTWHIWGALVALGFMILAMVIAPVFIAPLFNKYTPLADRKVVEPILRLARGNGVAADKVYEMDASKQTTRVSANVSGFLGTMRITLNDNLLKRCSLPEIEAVMAHEIGHYVLNHVFKSLLFFGVVIVVGFILLRWSVTRLLAFFGPRWGVTGITDLAVVPLVVFLLSAYFFVLTPFTNSFVRMQEMEADIFGLNAARQPDGFAEAALKLGEYRKMQPGPFEEWFFFDHPSGATRIRTAMQWKGANLAASPASASAK